MKGMKYTEVGAREIERYITDPQYVMAQKLDGTRVMVHVSPEGIKFHGVGDGPVTFAAAAQHFGALRQVFQQFVCAGRTLVVDGELIIETGEYWAFDLPYDREQGVTPETPFIERYLSLTFLPWVKRVPVAVTEEEKRSLWESVVAKNSEGVIIRPAESLYEVGRRSNYVRKVKLVKTADVVVLASSRGRNAAGREIGGFTLGVIVDGSPKVVGACSAIGKPECEIGDVIEVAFLYATSSMTLYQPRMLRKRPDKFPEDCGIEQVSQFVTNREVIVS